MTLSSPNTCVDGVGRRVRLSPAQWIFVASGGWLIMLGLYFAFLRPALLPEDVRFMGTSVAQVEALLPALAGWLRHVFVVMGGFMIASGLLTTWLAITVIGERRKGTTIVPFIAGLASVITMSLTNVALDSAFRWVLVVPAVVWSAGIVAYLREDTRRP